MLDLPLTLYLIDLKFKILHNISHYYNNIFAFPMPVFTISTFNLNKLNTTIHSNIIFMVIAYNQNLHFIIHYKKTLETRLQFISS